MILRRLPPLSRRRTGCMLRRHDGRTRWLNTLILVIFLLRSFVWIENILVVSVVIYVYIGGNCGISGLCIMYLRCVHNIFLSCYVWYRRRVWGVHGLHGVRCRELDI